MPVMTGRVEARRIVVEVEGRPHVVPRGCDVIKGKQLAQLVDQEVEVLMAKDTILAIRALDPETLKKLLITCYLLPPEIPFDPGIMRQLEPTITKSLVKSGYLDARTAEQLADFQGGN